MHRNRSPSNLARACDVVATTVALRFVAALLSNRTFRCTRDGLIWTKEFFCRVTNFVRKTIENRPRLVVSRPVTLTSCRFRCVRANEISNRFHWDWSMPRIPHAGFVFASGRMLSEGYGRDRPAVCLGDGQTEAEVVPSQGGRGDALIRRTYPYLT